jgi:replicative DNA helicase
MAARRVTWTYLAFHAERALLGAILSDPAGQQRVLGLLARDDFYRPWHGQVLAAMQRLTARQIPPGPLEVYAELRQDPDLPRSVSHDAVPIADLLHAVPRSAHTSAYAGIVIGSAIRRRLALAGGRLHQAGQTTPEPIDDHALHTARWIVSREHRDLRACWHRWANLPEPITRELPATPQDSQPDHHDKPTPGQPDPAAVQAGLTALRDLITRPDVTTAALSQLRPDHFAHPDHRIIYQSITELHQAAMPVDPVTVTWQATRHGLNIQPAELDGGCAAFAPASTTQVHRRAILAALQRTGLDIETNAANPRLLITDLIRYTGRQIAAAEHELTPQPTPISQKNARVLPLPTRTPHPAKTLDREATP